ncbi:hypothetical protein L596_014751 [Steinernema carpocapsae]|uniref:Uncharacterized protein n=1 Tax=Steinernema carpocapsae TaxID=34508 RepID=A0A4U5ND23_STECR|nr:hypothetical protein L596_014751 [Steinernema carpocapsae]
MNCANYEDEEEPTSSQGPTRMPGPSAGHEKLMRGLPRSYPPHVIRDCQLFSAVQDRNAAGTSNGISEGVRVRRKLPPTPQNQTPPLFYSPESAPQPYVKFIPPVNVSSIGAVELGSLNGRLRCLSCLQPADFCDHLGYRRIPLMMRGLIPMSPDTLGSTQHLGESHPSFAHVIPEVQKLLSHHWRTTERIRDDILPRFEMLREKYGFEPSMTSVRRPTINFPQYMVDEGIAIAAQREFERLNINGPSSTGEGAHPPRKRNPAGDFHPKEVVTLTPPPEDPVSQPPPKRKNASKKSKKRR